MAFWGIEVKPGKPVTHSLDKVRRRLRISQATLGIGPATTKSLVQCNVGNKSPVFLCALLPDKTESCHLDLEFEEADDVVFSVIGPRSVYLTGYHVSNDKHSALDSDTESYGEDIANTETEESGLRSDEDEYEDSFIDDGAPVESPPSPDRVDEEMEDEKKIIERKGSKKLKEKKFRIIDSDDETTSQESEDDYHCHLSSFKSKKAANGKILEVGEKTTAETNADLANCDTLGHVSKEKSDSATIRKEANSELAPVNNKNSKRKRKEHADSDKILEGSSDHHKEAFKEHKVLGGDAETDNKHQDLFKENESNQNPTTNTKVDGDDPSSLPHPASSENDQHTKKRRKKGSIKERSGGSNNATYEKNIVDESLKENLLEDYRIVSSLPAATAEDKKLIADGGTNFDFIADGNQLQKPKKKKKKGKNLENNENLVVNGSPLSENKSREPSMSRQVRTLSNGLVIEELALGEQEGKIAAVGKKVKVYYTAMLKDSGHIFESNVGKAPYKFRLGDEAIIEGWNIGLEGMRVGDKRRLIIPPSMGYGIQRAGENLPPNSWLVYDVELAGVR